MNSVRESRAWVGLAVAAVSVAVITGTNYGLREIAPAVSTGVVYLLAVLLVSSYWGLWLGLLTGLLSTASFNFFHLPPTGTFHLAEEDWVALGVYFVAAVVTSTLADAARTRAQEAERRRSEADLAAEMARLLLGGGSMEQTLPAVGRQIAQAFDLGSVSIEPRWVDSGERRRALPLLVEGERAGTLLVPRDTGGRVMADLQDRLVPALEALVGAARKREELEAQVIETKALRRSNVVKTTLLRSVSHDLRSPLTAIATAASGLTPERLSDEARRELTSVITTETARLSRLVDNLLDLSRLQTGAAEPRTDWCSIEELVRAAIDSVTRPEAGFDVSIDPDLPLIRADATQLERALANVLENSVRYAGAQPVAVRARAAVPSVTLRISDRGPGVPKEELERIFEPFHRSGEGRDGSGLGLAIARGFVEVNGGRLRAESLPGQGTSFILRLPIPKQTPEPQEPVA